MRSLIRLIYVIFIIFLIYEFVVYKNAKLVKTGVSIIVLTGVISELIYRHSQRNI